MSPVKISLKNNDSTSFFYYVPILETLKFLLKNQNVMDQCFTDHSSANKAVLRDIVDGKCCLKNESWPKHKNALKIILFQDAFEVCNPLGSARKKYKILGIYMTLANLKPWQRSKIDRIQLVALCFEQDLKNFGFSKIFEVIIKEINQLETEGIYVNETLTLKGSLLAVAGDNLGSHQIGGFLETFNVDNYFCRICYKNDGCYSTSDKIVYRTIHSYKEDLDYVLSTNNNYKGVNCE